MIQDTLPLILREKIARLGRLSGLKSIETSLETAIHQGIMSDECDTAGAMLAADELDAPKLLPIVFAARLERDKSPHLAKHLSALLKNVQSPYPWIQWAIAAIELDEPDDSILNAIEKALQLAPGHTWTWLAVGNIFYFQLQNHDRACECFRRTIEIDDQFMPGWIALASTLATHDEHFDEAECAFRKAIEIEPNSAMAWNGLGSLFADRSERCDEATEAYEKAIEADERSGVAWSNLGTLLLQRIEDSEVGDRRKERALEAFGTARKLLPHDFHVSIGWGCSLLKNGRYPGDALDSFKIAVSLRPECPNALILLARAQIFLDDFDEARNNLFKATSLVPKHPAAWHYLAQALPGKATHSKTWPRKAIERDPKFVDAWVCLAWMHLETNQLENAETTYREGLKVNPESYELWSAFSLFLGNENVARYKEAISCLEKGLRFSPRNARGWAALAALHWDNFQRFDEAEAALQQALELRPNRHEWWCTLGEYREQANRFEAAEQAYRKSIEVSPTKFEKGWKSLGSLLFNKLNRTEEAVDAYQQSIRSVKENRNWWDRWARILEQDLGWFELAEEALRKALEIEPNSQPTWDRLGKLLEVRFQRFDDAAEAYLKAAEARPLLRQSWKDLAQFYLKKLKREEDAIATYRKMVEHNSESVDAWVDQAIFLKDHDKFEDAHVSVNKALELSPENRRALNAVGLVFWREDKLDEAIAAFKRTLEVDSEYPWSWRNLARVHDIQGADEEAEKCYRTAIKHKPDYHSIMTDFGEFFKSRNRLEEAENWFRKAIEISPKYIRGWNQLGCFLERCQRLDEAFEAFEKTVEIKPDYGLGWRNMGDVCEQQKDYQRAEQYYLKAIEVDRENPYYWFKLADLASDCLNQFDRARQLYFEYFEIDPKHPTSYNNLAWMHFKFDRDLSEAEWAIRKALAIKSDDVHFVHTAVCLFARLGYWDEARLLAEKLISLVTEKWLEQKKKAIARMFNEFARGRRTDELLKLLEPVKSEAMWADSIQTIEWILARDRESIESLPKKVRKVALVGVEILESQA